MQRIQSQRQAEAIAAAIALLPPELQWVFGGENDIIHFFCGDPLFAGIHSYVTLPTDPSAREASQTAHALYQGSEWLRPPCERRNSVILPPADPYNFETTVLIHEIGHLVHESQDFEDFEFPDVSEYAGVNDNENFAEAFCSYIIPPYDGQIIEYPKNKLTRDDYRLLDVIVAGDDFWQPVWTHF